MPSLDFIGLGLNDEKGITVEGLEVARQADVAYAEFYTNLMPALDLRRLEQLVGKKIQVLNRTHLEEEGGRELLRAAKNATVAFLVPGDPMIATTHISLRLSLSKIGISSRVIHGPSIMSAVCGATGLQNYKFGRSITIPQDPPLPRSVPDTITDNNNRGLHTLVLLDVKGAGIGQMTIREGLAMMVSADDRWESRLAVGVARLGARDEKIKASKMNALIKEDFGRTPHSIIVPGKLHFMETEALKVLCGADDEDLRESR